MENITSPPATVVHAPGSPTTMLQPQPTSSRPGMLDAAPTSEYTMRSASPADPIFDCMGSRIDDPARVPRTPEPVFDRMASRIDEPGLAGRLTPQIAGD